MANKIDLTSRENEVLALAWQCFENEPKVDIAKLASLTGYTPGSASVTLGNIKRKLKNRAAGITKDSPTPKKSQGRACTTTPSSKKTKHTDMASGSESASATPSKRAKTSKGMKALDRADDEEFAVAVIKKEEISDINHSADNFYVQDAIKHCDD
ncbi:hypothetical protein GQ44DRAFT_829247 [Phaeosphaeriaceae sp. PMI808]|nr:hypothetical protein GQ44DRAFT_829247 [Phaeosphaeriaceae sp. PMI808]